MNYYWEHFIISEYYIIILNTYVAYSLFNVYNSHFLTFIFNILINT